MACYKASKTLIDPTFCLVTTGDRHQPPVTLQRQAGIDNGWFQQTEKTHKKKNKALESIPQQRKEVLKIRKSNTSVF